MREEFFDPCRIHVDMNWVLTLPSHFPEDGNLWRRVENGWRIRFLILEKNCFPKRTEFNIIFDLWGWEIFAKTPPHAAGRQWLKLLGTFGQGNTNVPLLPTTWCLVPLPSQKLPQSQNFQF